MTSSVKLIMRGVMQILNEHTCLWLFRILVHKSIQKSDDCEILQRVSCVSHCFTLELKRKKCFRNKNIPLLQNWKGLQLLQTYKVSVNQEQRRNKSDANAGSFVCQEMTCVNQYGHDPKLMNFPNHFTTKFSNYQAKGIFSSGKVTLKYKTSGLTLTM